METKKISKVALIGPESSGKSYLCEKLADHFKTLWVPEFSREYIGTLGRKYNYDDVIHCIHKQIENEDKAVLKANKILFCDTELIIAKIWLLDVYQSSPEWLDELIQNRHYDLYFLTYPDIDFIPDTVRENGNRREYFYNWYKKELDEQNCNYVIIKGADRLESSIAAIEKSALG